MRYNPGMTTVTDAATRAAARRATWHGQLTTEHHPVQASEASAEQRLALLTELSVLAWTLSGRPLPSYSRQTMPGRLIRRLGEEAG